MIPCHSNTRSRRLYSDFKFSTITQGTRGSTQHAHTQKQESIGYRKPDRIKVRVSHPMTEIQGQRPQDYVLAGSKTLERSGVGRKRPHLEKAPKTTRLIYNHERRGLRALSPARTAHAYAAASSLMQEEGTYGASDRLDHPYGWTVVDTTSMYSK